MARTRARLYSKEHQLAVGFHSYGADNGGFLPPGSGYLPVGHVTNRGVRGSGDFWDVLNPAYVEPMDAWYCPAGPFFGDTEFANGHTRWAQPTPYANCCIGDGDNGTFTYAFMANVWTPVAGALTSLPMFQKRPTHLDDPSDWTLILDRTFKCTSSSTYSWCPPDGYVDTNHPPFAMKPDGTNKCTMDGSVRWIPEAEAVEGYPGCGGSPGNNFGCVLIE